MKINLQIILIVLIVLIGAFFRLYNLSSNPPQPSVDEVSLGYNAYSILKTGADEYSAKFPVLLRAYDDFRPAIYSYLAIPFIAVFGLTPFAIRLPSVILSILTIIAVYFLARYLTKETGSIKIWKIDLDIPIITSLFFAISPWSIYLSRIGHEVNASFSFLIFGLLFFFRFLDKKKWSLIFSALFLGLSFDSYQSTKIIIPILALVLFILFYKNIIKERAMLILSIIAGAIVILPILLSAFDDQALIRFGATNLIGNSNEYFEQVSLRNLENIKSGDTLGRVFDNRKSAGALLISSAYVSHLNPVWLFFNKGDEPFKSPNMGLLYLFEFPLIIASSLFLRKSGISKKNLMVIISLALISIIPASITTGYPHAMRAYSLLPVLMIFSSAGFFYVAKMIKNRRALLGFVCFSLIVIIFSILGFFHSYFILLPRELSHHFQYGVINALTEAKKIENNYDLIVVSNKNRLFESYMFYLYLNKYDPILYQKKGGTISGGFAEEHKIDKYVFGDVKGKIDKNRLYIINPDELTNDMKIVSKIKYPNGEVTLIIAKSI